MASQGLPNIKAYRGESVQRKGVFTRIAVSPLGIYGTLRTPKGFVYLQPKEKKSSTIFPINELRSSTQQLNCLFVKNHSLRQLNLQPLFKTAKKRTAGTLRTYRFAVAGSAEYTQLLGDNDDSKWNEPERMLLPQ